MIINGLLYILSFILIWFGAGLIVNSIDKYAKKLHISSFAVSFFILGFLTSTPEIAVGISSIIEKDPEIYVGNLIGGIIIIFLFIIPILAIFGRGITLSHQLSKRNLLLSLAVCAAPAFLILDNKVTVFEGFLLIFFYIILFYVIEKKKGIIENIESKFLHTDRDDLKYIVKIVIGIIIVFLTSRFIVDETMYFSKILNISPFFISLIMLSLGTNLPELSVGIRSLYSGKKDIAFGDYIGSAAANTAIFGVLTVINKNDVTITDHFFRRFIFIIAGLGLFYFFSRSKNNISRLEGFILLLIYVLFLIVEFSFK